MAQDEQGTGSGTGRHARRGSRVRPDGRRWVRGRRVRLRCAQIPAADADVVVTDEDDAPRVAPIVTDDDGYPIVSTLPFIITDEDSGAEYVGTALSAATPGETMRTMVALSLGVSRETVRLWETDNYREYGFDTPHNAYRGTARFTVAARNPYRPDPVTLTHSNHS